MGLLFGLDLQEPTTRPGAQKLVYAAVGIIVCHLLDASATIALGEIPEGLMSFGLLVCPLFCFVAIISAMKANSEPGLISFVAWDVCCIGVVIISVVWTVAFFFSKGNKEAIHWARAICDCVIGIAYLGFLIAAGFLAARLRAMVGLGFVVHGPPKVATGTTFTQPQAQDPAVANAVVVGQPVA